MYGMTPMGVFFTAIFPLEINEQALCQQPQLGTNFRFLNSIKSVSGPRAASCAVRGFGEIILRRIIS